MIARAASVYIRVSIFQSARLKSNFIFVEESLLHVEKMALFPSLASHFGDAVYAYARFNNAGSSMRWRNGGSFHV